MTPTQIYNIVEGLIEQLAEIEHVQWAHWQKYVHENSVRLQDGSIVIPPDLVERWERQISTPYTKLSEKEKESDREQARIVIGLLKSVLKPSP
jgi:hypothetical protein